MGPGRVNQVPSPELGLLAPEGLVGLEAGSALGQAEVAQRAGVELGQLLPVVGAAAPQLQDVGESGVGAGQRRLGTVMERDVGHGALPGRSDDVDDVEMRLRVPLYKQPFVVF